MNQKTIPKLNLFLSGIQTRYTENKELFTALNFAFQSGLKSYKGRALPNANGLDYNFKGVTESLDLGNVLQRILKEAALYDSLVLTYEERGFVMEVTANDKDVKVSNKEKQSTKDLKQPKADSSTLLNRAYLVNHQQARPLLTELDILTKDGKVRNDKIRKYNQIDHYVEILVKDLEKFKAKGKVIHVVDCGCGKSYLSFVLNFYMTEVMKIKTKFTGIDISEKVIEASRAMADRLGYRNMEFIQGDIRNLKTQTKPDIVMSLHACDIATDLALHFAIRNDADLIVAVPCCHAEMNSKYSYDPFASIMKHGILKRRLADVLTDGVRCLILEQEGYDTSIMEYISPLETPKNLLIKAYKTGKRSSKAESELTDLILKLNYAPALYRYLNDLDMDDVDGICEEDDDDDDF